MNYSENVKQIMPTFFKNIEDNKVLLYNPTGFSEELTDDMEKIIEEMKNQGLTVVAVIESESLLPGETEPVHMLCYVYSEDDPWIIENGVVGFMANVLNDTWDIQEYGSIGLTEILGLVQRIY